MTFGNEITILGLELAKSLWAELRVGGSQCRHDWQALDLEPLIIFTASLAATDDAFITRTIRWCALNPSCISTVRLHRLSRRFSPTTRDSLDAFMRATGELARSQKLPGEWPDLNRPALIQLRLRALVGVGARAEILKLMMADPEVQKTITELVEDTAYGMDGCTHALEALSAAGVLKVEPAGRTFLYRLARPSDLTLALNGAPVAFPAWIAIFKVIDAIREYALRDGQYPAGRVAAAKRLTSALQAQFGKLGVAAEVPDVNDEESATTFERWARAFVAAHARATLQAEVNEASYSVLRLAHGGWIATVTMAGGQPRPLALSDTPILRPERRKQRRGKPDSLGDAALVVEMMLRDLLVRAMQRRLGSTVSLTAASEPTLPGVSREFAEELLLPMHAGDATSFSEKFLHRWLANRRHWHDLSA